MKKKGQYILDTKNASNRDLILKAGIAAVSGELSNLTEEDEVKVNMGLSRTLFAEKRKDVVNNKKVSYRPHGNPLG